MADDTTQPANQRTISVTGTGTASRPPDVARVSIGISVVHRGVAEATETAATLAAGLVTAVREAGVGDEDLQTIDYSVNAEYDHRPQQRVLVGFRVNNTLEVLVRPVEALTDVLAAASTAGGDATTINGVALSRDEPRDLVIEARAAAWNDALTAARQLADLAGRDLGAARSITEGQAGAIGPAPVARRAMMAEAAIPIEAGSVSVSVNLLVDFDLT